MKRDDKPICCTAAADGLVVWEGGEFKWVLRRWDGATYTVSPVDYCPHCGDAINSSVVVHHDTRCPDPDHYDWLYGEIKRLRDVVSAARWLAQQVYQLIKYKVITDHCGTAGVLHNFTRMSQGLADPHCKCLSGCGDCLYVEVNKK